MALYLFPLAFSGQKFLNRNIDPANRKKSKKAFVFLFIGILAAASALHNISLPPFLLFTVMSFGFLLALTLNLNIAFRLGISQKYYGLACFVLILPLLVSISLMREQVFDESIPGKDRADLVSELGILNKHLTEENLIYFLDSTSDYKYSSFLEDYYKKISMLRVLKTASTLAKANAFIDTYDDKAYSENEVREVVSHMVQLKKDSRLGYDFDRYSYSFFNQQIVSTKFLHELLNTDNSYMQLAALTMARNMLNKSDFFELYETYRSKISDDVKNDNKIKCWTKEQLNNTT